MTTWEDPIPRVTPATAVVLKPEPAPARVVDANPTPADPILMVWPLTTIVVGVAEAPILYVVPAMITSEAPMPTLTPAIAVVAKFEPTKVVEAKPTPLGPMLMVCPLTTIVVGSAEDPTA